MGVVDNFSKNFSTFITQLSRSIRVIDMKQKKDVSDAELLRGIRGGDSSCFEELFRRYYSRLVCFVTGIIKDRSRAEDIAMSIFMRFWTIRFTFDDSSPVKNWLCVCARNAAIDFLRSKSRICLGQLSEEMACGEDVEETISASMLLHTIDESASELPEQRGRIFKMSREEHLSNEAIAQRLGLSVRTVEKHIQLALRDIRNKLS